jgi:K+-transporting ATPase ATPase C chain
MSALRPPLVLLLLFTVLTGAVYPAVVTAAAQLLFPSEANGSLIAEHGRVLGSRLIGQPFSDAKYFWSRPSATAPVPYNAAASSGSNLGPLNPALRAAISQRVAALRAADPGNHAQVPVDLVTASASGLDPHISPASAFYQAERVAKARGVPADSLRALVTQHSEGPTLGLLGEPRVNVLALNLALDVLLARGPARFDTDDSGFPERP